MTRVKTTIDEFKRMLKGHDWYYMYSDDHSVYLRGKKNSELLLDIAASSVQHYEVYKNFTQQQQTV